MDRYSHRFPLIFSSLITGYSLPPDQKQQLIALAIAQQRSLTFIGTSRNQNDSLALIQEIQEQAEFLSSYYEEFQDFCQCSLGLYQVSLDLLRNFWLPLAFRLRSLNLQHKKPWIQGIVGLQGTGKTTLTHILIWLLQRLGCRSVSLSLDDLYLPYSDRLKLQQQNPFLIGRGPPGTHDVTAGITDLTALQHHHSPSHPAKVSLPRFDKSLHQGAGDRCPPEIIEGSVDIILFEGWFVGACPLAQSAPLSPLARYANEQLQHYLPLWDTLDGLLVLKLTDHHYSKIWRKSAEQKLRQRHNSGMTDTEIDRFVQYFWEALPPEQFVERLIPTLDRVEDAIILEVNEQRSIKLERVTR